MLRDWNDFGVKILWVLFLILSFAKAAQAAVAAGVGFSSTTSGRQVPALAAAVDVATWTVSGYSAGVTTPLYSHSGYLLQVSKPFLKGDFLGTVEFGVGGGIYYAHRALRATPSAQTETNSTFALGPSFRTVWRPVGPLYVGFDVLIGVRPSTAMLNWVYQDAVAMSLGFEL